MCCAAALLFASIPAIVRSRAQSNILAAEDARDHATVAIVFGAGLRRDGAPSDVLRDRLRVAADLYNAGAITTIVVSGDNRFENYDEPTAMQNALVNTFGIPVENIVVDYAGRRTYDTCARAKELWGVDRAVLVTQAFHLPRALWTCEHLGIDSVGVSATLRAYRGDNQFVAREQLALYKAFIDLYIWPPSYLGGPFERDIDP